MSPKQKPDLAAALSEFSGSARRRNAPLPSRETPARDQDSGSESEQGRKSNNPATPVYQAPSRNGTAPITGHFPRQVRDQLKILAIERSSTLYNLMAEAYNDLFAKYGKPEIAPQQMVDK